MTKHKNNHARSKQKRKALRLKNFWERVLNNRHIKKMAKFKSKGKSIIGSAESIATKVDPISQRYLLDNRHNVEMNQRQRRKLERQAPHRRKKK